MQVLAEDKPVSVFYPSLRASLWTPGCAFNLVSSPTCSFLCRNLENSSQPFAVSVGKVKTV